MKNDVHLKGQLKLYMQWPIFMAIFLIAMNLWIFRIHKGAGVTMCLFVLIYIVVAGLLYSHNKSQVAANLGKCAAQYGLVQNVLLKDLSIPYGILQDDGKIIWVNDSFEKLFEGKVIDKYLSNFIHELNRSIFPKDEECVELEVSYEKRDYVAKLSRVCIPEMNAIDKMFHVPEDKKFLIAVSLEDITDLNRYIKENEEQKLVAGLIYIDN